MINGILSFLVIIVNGTVIVTEDTFDNVDFLNVGTSSIKLA